MAWDKIRYFVEKPGASGGKRYFWQPSTHLRSLGWQPVRLPDDRETALAEAKRLNRALDDWRKGLATEAADSGRQVSMPPPLPPPGTVGRMIHEYKTSADFLDLAAGTQANYRLHLDIVEAWAGDAPIRAITPPRVQVLYKSIKAKGVASVGKARKDHKADRSGPAPAAAASVVRVIRLLWSWGIRNGHATDNPASRPGVKGSAAKGLIWSAEQIEAMVAQADEMGLHSVATAILIAEWIGQREGDILRLTGTQYTGGRFLIRQRKTGALVQVAASPHLAERLAAEAARHHDASPIRPLHLLISEETGRLYTENYFAKVFARVRAAAHANRPDLELDQMLFRYFRHTAVTRLFEAGCELPLIASITGHSLKHSSDILDRYGSRTAKMASIAVEKRLKAEPRHGKKQIQEE